MFFVFCDSYHGHTDAVRHYFVHFLRFRCRVEPGQRLGDSRPPERILLLHIPTNELLAYRTAAILLTRNQNKSMSLRALSPLTIGVDVGISTHIRVDPRIYKSDFTIVDVDKPEFVVRR